MVIDRDGAPRAGRMTAVACACLIAVAGCAPTPAPQPTTNPPTAAPIFESDEEALAAATEAYGNYLRLSNEIAHGGGNDAQRMSEVATGEALQSEVESLEGMRRAGTIGVGEVRFDNLEMQSADFAAGLLTAYVCLDVSGTDVVDASGLSVLPDDRVDRLPLEIGFVYEAEMHRLLLERTEVWDGENFCQL
jgi:hypothetical protein